jgi:hypothetical protein
MDKDLLIDQLEKHLKAIETVAIELYLIKLRGTIDKLKRGYYEELGEELIGDLQSVGFQDLAVQVRRSMYR